MSALWGGGGLWTREYILLIKNYSMFVIRSNIGNNILINIFNLLPHSKSVKLGYTYISFEREN